MLFLDYCGKLYEFFGHVAHEISTSSRFCSKSEMVNPKHVYQSVGYFIPGNL